MGDTNLMPNMGPFTMPARAPQMANMAFTRTADIMESSLGQEVQQLLQALLGVADLRGEVAEASLQAGPQLLQGRLEGRQSVGDALRPVTEL